MYLVMLITNNLNPNMLSEIDVALSPRPTANPVSKANGGKIYL